jgi:hypothetical protein
MNWEFFDLMEEALNKGFKSKWVLYRAKEFGIKFTLEDIKELGEAYRHKPRWAYYMAIEFEVLGFKKQEPPPKEKPKEKPPPKSETFKSEYPKFYFNHVSNKADLKKAFRDWSKKLHPDMQNGNSAEFIKMKNQYDNMIRRLI